MIRGWLDAWPWPFAIILLSPVATILWQIERIGGMAHGSCDLSFVTMEAGRPTNMWHCAPYDLVPTLAPGLINLLPVFWLFAAKRTTRVAGAIAGSLGLIRVGAPALLYLLEGPLIEVPSTYWPPPPAHIGLSVTLWVLSFAAAMIFGAAAARTRDRAMAC